MDLILQLLIFNFGLLTIMKGFTLIELIVSVAVIIIISAIALANYHFGGDIDNLNSSVQELVTNIRKVQHLALSAAEFEGDVPKGGYGLYFDINNTSSYILFADCDRDKEYDESGSAANCASAVPWDPYPEKIEEGEIKLRKGIKIKEVKLEGNPVLTASLVFTPPDPEIYVDGDNSFFYLDIILCIEGEKCQDYKKRVRFLNGGRIEYYGIY